MQFTQAPEKGKKGSVIWRGGTVGRGRTLQASRRHQDAGRGLRQRTTKSVATQAVHTPHAAHRLRVRGRVAPVRRELASTGQGVLSRQQEGYDELLYPSYSS